MKNLLLLATLGIMLSSAIAPNSKVVTAELPGCQLKIGDTYAGGIVFYLDTADACHGLVCAPSDQGQNIKWTEAGALCKSLNSGGFSDWRLPTKNELNQMFRNLKNNRLGSFGDDFYWSSNESYPNFMWGQDFKTGYQLNYSKYFTYSVRAVRAF
jgi:hypothetical protein